jgi:hypothetical protein
MVQKCKKVHLLFIDENSAATKMRRFLFRKPQNYGHMGRLPTPGG